MQHIVVKSTNKPCTITRVPEEETFEQASPFKIDNNSFMSSCETSLISPSSCSSTSKTLSSVNEDPNSVKDNETTCNSLANNLHKNNINNNNVIMKVTNLNETDDDDEPLKKYARNNSDDCIPQ